MNSWLEKTWQRLTSPAFDCLSSSARANLAFGAAVEPRNAAIATRLQALSDGRPSVPFPLAGEFESNVFLRCDEVSVREATSRQCGRDLNEPVELVRAVTKRGAAGTPVETTSLLIAPTRPGDLLAIAEQRKIAVGRT